MSKNKVYDGSFFSDLFCMFSTCKSDIDGDEEIINKAYERLIVNFDEVVSWFFER